MGKTLTKKETLALEYFLQGDNQTEAVMKAFGCKNRDSARSLASRVFRKQKVSNALAERQGEVRERLIEGDMKFIDLVLKYTGGKEPIAQALAQNILSKDKRVADAAIDKFLKISAEYPPQRVIEMQYQKQLEDDDKVIVVFKDSEEYKALEERRKQEDNSGEQKPP